jgi:hypothetical protein
MEENMERKRKELPSVKLERHPHRDAKERLRQAYQLLIEAHQNAQGNAKVEKDEEHTPQEVTP